METELVQTCEVSTKLNLQISLFFVLPKTKLFSLTLFDNVCTFVNPYGDTNIVTKKIPYDVIHDWE